jgi:hypothetical protein
MGLHETQMLGTSYIPELECRFCKGRSEAVYIKNEEK